MDSSQAARRKFFQQKETALPAPFNAFSFYLTGALAFLFHPGSSVHCHLFTP